MDEPQQKVQIKWVGGTSAGQDVSIRLVTEEPERATVAVVKVHSQVLITYSNYFKACLSERWAPRTGTSDFVLDLHTDVECYFDCFARMYSPLLKNFHVIRNLGDVKYSLELLKVASLIEFHELMDSISQYLSNVLWSPEDEMRIREYSSSPGFSRFHAEDLVERLGLDESDETRHKQLCEFIQQCVRSALSHGGSDYGRACCRALLTEFLQGIGSAPPSKFAKTVVMVIIKEGTIMFHEFEKECERKPPSHYDPVLEGKLQAVFWVLDAILRTDVAEDLVQSFAQLQFVLQTILTTPLSTGHPVTRSLAKLVLRIYEGVVGGHLLLETPVRVALLANWRSLLVFKLRKEEYDEATKQLFLTLPLKNQMELINLNHLKFDDYISTSSLISTILKGCNWQAMTLDLDAAHPEDS